MCNTILSPIWVQIYLFLMGFCVNSRIQETAGIPYNRSPTTKDDMKLTKTMVLIFGCFVLCFLPLMIVNVIDEKVSMRAPILHYENLYVGFVTKRLTFYRHLRRFPILECTFLHRYSPGPLLSSIP